MTSLTCGLLFPLLIIPFDEQKFLTLTESNSSLFFKPPIVPSVSCVLFKKVDLFSPLRLLLAALLFLSLTCTLHLHSLGLGFRMWYNVEVKGMFFQYGSLIDPAPFTEKCVLSLLLCDVSLWWYTRSPEMGGFVSTRSALFHWLICFSSHYYRTVVNCTKSSNFVLLHIYFRISLSNFTTPPPSSKSKQITTKTLWDSCECFGSLDQFYRST